MTADERVAVLQALRSAHERAAAPLRPYSGCCVTREMQAEAALAEREYREALYRHGGALLDELARLKKEGGK